MRKVFNDISVFAYSSRGCETAARIADILQYNENDKATGAGNRTGRRLRLYTISRLARENAGFCPLDRPSAVTYQSEFEKSGALVFVGAMGIAVRNIAPYVNDKKTDPAVICVDELGKYVIPVLSGHIGGANMLAKELAEQLNAIPVITTATDINGRFSVDAWAAGAGFIIDNMSTAKEISASILERDLPLMCSLPVKTEYPGGTFEYRECGNEKENEKERPDLGIYIGYSKKEPFDRTLKLIPPIIHLGIGCRRGTTCEAIKEAVNKVLEENGIDERAVNSVNTIDIKKDEPGLCRFCEEKRWPLHTFTAQELNAVKGNFSSSAFVQGVTGTDNVCERAAMINAENLLVRKTACSGVTVAAAAESAEISFK